MPVGVGSWHCTVSIWRFHCPWDLSRPCVTWRKCSSTLRFGASGSVEPQIIATTLSLLAPPALRRLRHQRTSRSTCAIQMAVRNRDSVVPATSAHHTPSTVRIQHRGSCVSKNPSVLHGVLVEQSSMVNKSARGPADDAIIAEREGVTRPQPLGLMPTFLLCAFVR